MVSLVSNSGREWLAIWSPQAKAMRLQRVSSRPELLARAKRALCVECSKIALKSLFRKGVREPNFFESDSKARAFARAGWKAGEWAQGSRIAGKLVEANGLGGRWSPAMCETHPVRPGFSVTFPRIRFNYGRRTWRTIMANRVCPTCGVELPGDAPEALCPRCLMQAGFDSPSSDDIFRPS